MCQHIFNQVIPEMRVGLQMAVALGQMASLAQGQCRQVHARNPAFSLAGQPFKRFLIR